MSLWMTCFEWQYSSARARDAMYLRRALSQKEVTFQALTMQLHKYADRKPNRACCVFLMVQQMEGVQHVLTSAAKQARNC